MNRIQMFLWRTVVCTVGLLAWPLAAEDSGIPALLLNAERYQTAGGSESGTSPHEEKTFQLKHKGSKASLDSQFSLRERYARLHRQQADLEVLRADLADALEKNQELTRLTTEHQQQTTALREEVKLLTARASWLTPAEKLTTPQMQEAYAAGVSLGNNVVEVQQQQAALGVVTDRQVLLSGVIDAVLGQTRLEPEALHQAMLAAELNAKNALENTLARQKKAGEAYIAEFSKQQGSKYSPAGFWYRIDYAGDAGIPATAVVDLVVKEMLTDGTVIQDMDDNGAALSQPLAQYPPLFREAIGLLKNHGSMQLVVPASLAYGDEGYLPKVLPGTTMVYHLRIAEISSIKEEQSKPL
ncbi:FKBP-type peptidyl-prolyl cis-trans isomerase N-terminal domain-containing protein [Erwinia sorbitola]|uniref:peptidylprolyl isomerase n=1 Tax=Erwinia sorbitola TaxID=2681984 RepID=A0A6I6EPD0_9GAMM|nr:FKBP-type peptidyl-prolyl cis-trans isomerase N-terminal domain-containing protein [Erwinia sorbitola]MTD28407.1 FKBP-type peptidylprolyl isomerase [Erwinia sorbitola]QGU86522.1 FKBP-type peptidylprolyl isomerase [Erwinia sorbitola]